MATDVASNKELVRVLANDVWNEGNVEELGDLLAPDFTGRGFEPEDLDRDGYQEFVTEHQGIFPDLDFVIEDMLGEDDRIAIRWTRSGTREEPVMGIEPNGNRITVSGMTIYRIRDGRIDDAWNVRDTGALMRQLGVLPDSLEE